MQDWNYEKVGCMEITIELSEIKYPNAAYLPAYWAQNKNALLAYLEQVSNWYNNDYSISL